MAISTAINKIELFMKEKIKTSEGVLKEHGRAEPHFPEFLPDAVVFVESTKDVSKILKIFAKGTQPDNVL